jgi:hypothetical protein
MTSSQAASFATIIVALATILALVLTGAPCLARMWFRHRLEAIRDDGVDAILNGQLRQEFPVSDFLHALELGGKGARWLTIARSVAVVAALADCDVDDPRNMVKGRSHCDLEPGERKVIHGLEERAAAAWRSYLIWGSPLGWALAPLASVAARYRPHGKVARTEDALPAAAREAMCAEYGSHGTASRWPGSLHTMPTR